MKLRPATDDELRAVEAKLAAYAQVYLEKFGSTDYGADYLIDGQARNIEAAGWILYEGVESVFPNGMLTEVLPIVALNVLVETENCEWEVVEITGELAVTHESLSRPVTISSLNNGEWLRDCQDDEAPSVGQVALESCDDIKHLLAKKRIFGG